MTLALAGYDTHAAELIPHWLKLDTAEILAPVVNYLPSKPSRILDIGAGVGLDAAWFAEQGHDVLAVEPCQTLREAGVANRSGPHIAWLDDRLPKLPALKARGETFDLVTLLAVWAHLDPCERRMAMPNVAALVAPGGRLIISIRDGWTPPSRPVFPAAPEATVEQAEAEGLKLVFRTEAGSIQAINQANGVSWHWLVFDRPW